MKSVLGLIDRMVASVDSVSLCNTKIDIWKVAGDGVPGMFAKHCVPKGHKSSNLLPSVSFPGSCVMITAAVCIAVGWFAHKWYTGSYK